MTSLLTWFAADGKKDVNYMPASIYIATDSLITWQDGDVWQHGKKVFACSTSPDVFGFCGDRLFASAVLGQIVNSIDSGYLFGTGEDAAGRMSKVAQLIRQLWDTYPAKKKDKVHIVHVTREGEGVGARFLCQEHKLYPNKAPQVMPPIAAPAGERSRAIMARGSGQAALTDSIDEWNRQYSNRHTSRAVFAAFCASVQSRRDAATGGVPQLVGLYRIGNGRSFGVVWEDKLYFDGLFTLSKTNKDGVKWRNHTFEIADPKTRQRAADAAPHIHKYDLGGNT